MRAAELIACYDQRVPRYTSYPTAPHFAAAVDAGVYATWLQAMASNTPLSLYLHVPFCARLCLFCGCHTTAVNQTAPVEAYAHTLLAEIDLLATTIHRRLEVRHVHWGGGTPTMLPPHSMRAIDARLRERFEIRSDAEIAVEVDPRTLDTPALEALASIGVSRASVGIQDVDPAVQNAIGRIQPWEASASSVARLRQIGIRSINLDLLYGLPYQTEASVAATMRDALTLAPERVAVFGYAHVPWMKKHQALLPSAALPDAMSRYAQCRAAERVLRDSGYEAIGLDHFARPEDQLAIAARTGALHRNFQGYTTDDAPVLLGLGASSIGSLPQGYVQNASSVPSWRAAIRDGRLPVVRGVALTREDRLRRAVIERIMCDLSVDLATVAARHDAAPSSLMDAAPALEQMSRDGLIHWSGDRLTVTDVGRPFARTVAAAFDTYLRTGAARHAVAV
jgi:oxygen-independent coproporphyrinogen-3 oxidase